MRSLLRSVKNLQDVVDWELCSGCGVCKYAATTGKVELVNIETSGIRPVFDARAAAASSRLLDLCPGYSVDARGASGPSRKPTAADQEYGQALEIWEGYASDSEVRYRGSSGGALTALALWCLERGNMAFVLHTGMDPNKPWLNTTFLSRTRAELLGRAGSRYAPASPCEGLGEIEHSDRPCVFIGKPCDTAAAMAARWERPTVDQRLGVVLAFFCAGTPSTRGTLDLLGRLNIQPAAVNELRYRGDGWPGGFAVTSDMGARHDFIPYREAWRALTPHIPLRCRLCPDGLGRVADISCGDAWEKYDEGSSNPGVSIIIVRTKRGQEILHGAVAGGYLNLAPASSDRVFAAQPHLLSKRRELFGRLLALRLLGIPVPRFRGFSQFHSWVRLPFLQKLRTVGGTLLRAAMRGWWKRRNHPEPLFEAPSQDPRGAARLRGLG